jgi:hypothetical protein
VEIHVTLPHISYRARESFATAEVEVLSSTSENVCKRYNGNEIIRKEEKTETKEFIYRPWTEADGSSEVKPSDVRTRPIYENWVFDLREACSIGVIEPTGYLSKRIWHWKDFFTLRGNKSSKQNRDFSSYTLSKLASDLEGKEEEGQTRNVDDGNKHQEIGPEVFKHLEGTAPNIKLHVPNAIVPPWELWAFAIFGVSVQSAVLALSGITIYRWHFQKSGAIVSDYAYPCFLAGTIALSAGLLICARTIQGSTENTNFELAKPPPKDIPNADSQKNESLRRAQYDIVRIQRYAEKESDSWVIFNYGSDGTLRTSRSRGPQYKQMSGLGSFLAVVGY